MQANKIKNLIQSLIEKLGVNEVTLDVINNNGILEISIQSPDEKALIGHDNEKFEAFSHIIKRITAKEFGEDIKIVVDINNMRTKKEEILKSKASIIADRARAFKIDVEMDPMSSYDRRIIHSHLESSPNIKTESIGEGYNRRLVVKYIEEA